MGILHVTRPSLTCELPLGDATCRQLNRAWMHRMQQSVYAKGGALATVPEASALFRPSVQTLLPAPLKLPRSSASPLRVLHFFLVQHVARAVHCDGADQAQPRRQQQDAQAHCRATSPSYVALNPKT